jgi:prepilin-type N-terminal cleavage/methylation domain-containing protein
MSEAGEAAMKLPRPLSSQRSAFTLIEMLVVIGIVAVILAIALPNLRGLHEGTEMDTASRQLLSDLSQARARAINNRTTVAVVFVPREVLSIPLAAYPPMEAEEIKRLQAGILSQYTLFASRRVGDQPGRASPRYLTEWKSLPEKTFIAEDKFAAYVDTGLPQFEYAPFPFPFDTNTTTMRLPYVAFNYEGRLCNADGTALAGQADIRIPLARGSIMFIRKPSGEVDPGSVMVAEVPPGNSVITPNHIVIDWLTGRARLERLDLQNAP